MRFDKARLFGAGALGAGLLWAVRNWLRREPVSAATDHSPPQPRPPEAGDTVSAFTSSLALQEGNTRGPATVAVVFGIAFAIVVGGAGVKAVQDRMETRAQAMVLTRGDPSHAPALMQRYGCAGCHTVAGVPGADGKVGPALASLRERVIIGGTLPNTPGTLIGWIVDPQRFSPHSAMPATGISEAEARDVAAYLYMN